MGMVAGADDSGLALVRLLADPNKLAAALAQFEEAQAKAKEAVATLGVVDDIYRLRGEAEAKLKHADETLARANAQSATILEDTGREANRLIEIARSQAHSILEEARNARENAQRLASEASREKATQAQLTKELLAKERALNAVEASIAERQKDLDARESEVASRLEKLEKLKQVIDTTME